MERQPGGGRVELAFLAGTGLVTVVAVSAVLRLWRADFRVPFVYFYDAVFNAAVVKAILDSGWHLDNPSLGAPSGLEMHDFPLGGDNLQFLLLKFLGLFSGDWALVMNAYFLLGFVLTSLTAYFVLRQVGSTRWPALVLASVFALLPYHFVMGETQLFQSAYFVVPLGALLVLDVVGWDIWKAPFLARAGPGRPRARVVRWAIRCGVAVVVASAGSYYAPFTMVLLVAAAGLAVLAGDRRAVLRAVAVVGLLAAVLAANNAPTLLYWRDHGRNAEVADRAPGESDLYALRFIDLFLPIQAHRVPPLAATKARLDRFWPVSPIWPAPQTPLGVAGATGLAVTLGAVAAAVAARRRPLSPAFTRLAQLGVLNLTAVLTGVATGLSGVFALVGVTEVRVWSRLSVFVGFFGLVGLGHALEIVGPRLRARVPRRTARPVVVSLGGAVLAMAAVGLATLDQTQPGMVPSYAANGQVFAEDRAFVAAIEQRLPPGSAVLQLPLARFPEQPPVASMQDYQLLRGYLHSGSTRWSYGAMRGRPAEWAWSLGGRSTERVLDGATAAGFTGLYVDRAGFFDGAAALEAELNRLVGAPAVVSPHGLAFWDLRERAAAQRARLGDAGLARLRHLVLQPVRPSWGSGFGPPLEPAPSVPGQPATAGDFVPYPALPGRTFVTLRVAGSPSFLELRNPLPERRTVRVSLTVSTNAPDGDSLHFAMRGALAVDVAATAMAAPVELRLRLPPGSSTIEVTSATGAAFVVGNVVIDDEPSS